MSDQLVNVKLKMVTDGSTEAVKSFSDLNEEAARAAASIQAADEAARGLNTSVEGMGSMPMASDFWDAGAQKQIQDDIKATSKGLEKAGGSAVELGEAGEQLSSVLDSVVPGLGGIAESLMSMNPVAIAGTVAITGLVLALGEMQRQAEEARAAGEAMAQAESDRVLAEITTTQRINQAIEGDKGARQQILRDLADYTAAKETLEQQGIENSKNIAEQLKIINNLDNDKADNLSLEESRKRIEARRNAQGALDGFDKTAVDLAAQMETVQTQFVALSDAAKEVGITAAEQAAINKGLTLGADGATAALDKLWTGTKGFTDLVDSTADGLKKAFEDIGENAVKMAEETAKKAEEVAKAREKAESDLLETNMKLTEVESERGRALADRVIEEQRAAEMSALETRLAAAQEYDQQQAKNKKLADLQTQAQADQIAADSKFFDNQQKLLSSYLKSEQTATEDYSRERVRKLEDLYNSLNDLASQRDVAGFVNARRNGMTDLSRGDEDFGVSAQKRKAQYEQAAADQQAAYAKENATRQSQLQQKLQQEQQAGQAEITATSRAQKAIADLRAQWAAQDLRARRQQEDQAYKQTVDILQKKRLDELKITQGAAAGVISILSNMKDSIVKLGSGISQTAARGLPRFDVGTPFVERTGAAIIHRGEAVLTAAENARYMRGGNRGGGGNYTINLSVGEHVSQSELTAVKNEIVGAIVSFGANSNN